MNGQTKGRLDIDLMNSETRIGDYIRKQVAERLPFFSSGIHNGIRGQNSTEILLEPEGDGVFEGKLHWRCAEFSRRNSSQVRILRQGLIVLLSGLNGCSRRSCYFGQSNRVVRRRRSGCAVPLIMRAYASAAFSRG